ncbi:MAG: hypothetical protein OXC13_10995 [Caldilineaceae bacterium]|nr:hypothetical protein [Caldilineaceae bacterium]
MESATNTEYFLVRKTAEEYRNKGYEVSLEATLDFLPGFRADLVVRKDGETKVIEVKSRSSLAANPKIRELAAIVESKPGWSFELLLVAEPEKLESPEGERPLERGHILQRIEEAEHLLAADHADAAFLLAWAACEAAIRMLIAEQGGSGNGITTTNHLVNQATYLGILSREEYRHLTRMQKYRNAVAHGYSHDDVSEGLISDLVESVRRIATEIDA